MFTQRGEVCHSADIYSDAVLGANLDLSNCQLLYREIKLNYGTLHPRNS